MFCLSKLEKLIIPSHFKDFQTECTLKRIQLAIYDSLDNWKNAKSSIKSIKEMGSYFKQIHHKGHCNERKKDDINN